MLRCACVSPCLVKRFGSYVIKIKPSVFVSRCTTRWPFRLFLEVQRLPSCYRSLKRSPAGSHNSGWRLCQEELT